MKETQIRELNRQIEEARKAYYVDAQPIMSDAEYDLLEMQLGAAVTSAPEFSFSSSNFTSRAFLSFTVRRL